MSVYDYSRITGNEAASERYQQLQCNKRLKNKLAILLKQRRSRSRNWHYREPRRVTEPVNYWCEHACIIRTMGPTPPLRPVPTAACLSAFATSCPAHRGEADVQSSVALLMPPVCEKLGSLSTGSYATPSVQCNVLSLLSLMAPRVCTSVLFIV